MIPYDGRTAAVRYNNPGAQYPSPHARRYGMTGYGQIGGGHKIAYFPSEAHGAAANMDNFARNYRGLTLGDAVRKWRGGNGGLSVPAGFDPKGVVDDGFLGDRDRMTRFFSGMSTHEGRGAAGPVKPETWGQAYDWYRAGGAPAAGGQTMQPLGMLRPLADRPAQPAAAGGADPNALGAISPEHIKTLGAMGMLRPHNSGQPRNVGEALGQIGDMIYDRANTNYVLSELRKGAAAENAAWANYGGPGSPQAAPSQTAATESPGVPGGTITAGRRFGSNPSPTPAPITNWRRPIIEGGYEPSVVRGALADPAAPADWNGPRVAAQPITEPDPGRPAIVGGMITAGNEIRSLSAAGAGRFASPGLGAPVIAGGMIDPGARFSGGERLTSQDMAPPQWGPGMLRGGAPAPEAPGDPRSAWLDAQEAQALQMIRSDVPKLRERGLALEEDIRQRRYELMDPKRAADIDLTRAQAEKARREVARGGKRSLNPVWGKDAQGNDILMQLGEEGDATRTALPEGVTANPGSTSRVDLGTHWGVLDRSGTLIGRLPKDVAGEAAAREEGKAQGQARVNVDAVRTNAALLRRQIQGIRDADNLSSVTGWQAYLPTLRSSSIDTEERIKQLQGGVFLQAYESLKGAGQITEIEGEKAERAKARIQNRKQSDAGYVQALQDFEEEVMNLVRLAERKAGIGANARGAAAPADPLGIR